MKYRFAPRFGAFLVSTALICSGVATAQADDATFTSQRIALGGDGVFPNYRIPAIVQLENGDLLASYDGRPTGGDAPGPNSILQRRSSDGGATWGAQEVIAAGVPGAEKKGYSDPSYVVDRNGGTLFNFHVYSKDTGFWNSEFGNDDADRKVMSAVVSISADNGATWTDRSVTEVVKPDSVRATFASSGHGIQITRGAYAGRLVQQYAGAMSDGTVASYSLYSDDGGQSWQRGNFVGTNMDENKVVELSDGRLMLNSRMHTEGGARYVSYSDDGAQTWSEPQLDYTLTDPRNNASIIQMNPGAPAGSREAKELLFSNSNSATARVNGSMRYSCDDGQTWPVVKVYEPGDHSYSDLVALADGTFGVFYETTDSELRYGQFDRNWLQPFCAAFETATATVNAGETGVIIATIRNDEAKTMPAGSATLTGLPKGWQAETVPTPAIASGETLEVTIPLTAPNSARSGLVRGDVQVSGGDIVIRGDAEITVEQGAADTLGVEITGNVGEDRDVATNPYSLGDEVPYHFSVTSTANITETVTPVAGDFEQFLPPNAPNCRWKDLAIGASYECTTPIHRVSEGDLADGFFNTQTSWELSAADMEPVKVLATAGEVDVRVRAPEITLSRENVQMGETQQAGDTISFDVVATNTGNVRLTAVTGALSVEELAVDNKSVRSETYTLTEADLANGSVTLPALAISARNGEREVMGEVDALTIELTPPRDAVPSDPAPPKPDLPITGANSAMMVLVSTAAIGGGWALRRRAVASGQ